MVFAVIIVSLYCAWLPCTDCARGIIQVGISKLVVKSFQIPERWVVDMVTSVTMLKEAGVEIQLFDKPHPAHWDIILQELNGKKTKEN